MARPKNNTVEGDKHKRILEAAGSMFVELGFNAVSMDALAEAAPVSKPTLYKHFQDKKALFIAVMESRCSAIFKAFEDSVAEETDCATALTNFGQRYMDLVLSPQAIAIHRIIVAESQNFPELGEIFYKNGPDRMIAQLAAWLEKLHRSGILIVPQSRLSASLFLNALKGEIHMRAILMRETPPVAERQSLLNYAVQAFLRAHQSV